ncbi:hypothetical protein BRADI_1g38974v3 [Brachypodium distachyon]|uniref:Uncharacterized protein n=1 Tax=Brachypodium distachyon TaxID=15368 RepID=A0A0Q3H5G5_BRADI|nr:hypothetical protein BRADI_1g38974v3 [Brachypodium distachyon]
MAGDDIDVEGEGHLNQPITRLHFNALRDHLRREFRNSLQPIEEKQDKMSEDLQHLMDNVNEQLTQNMTTMRADLVAGIVRELRQQPQDASVHGDEQHETNDEAEASDARARRQQHAAPRGMRPPGPGRGNGGVAARGRGCGEVAGGRGLGGDRQRENLHRDDSEDEFDEDNYGLHRNGRFCWQRNYGREHQEEERFDP